jgi:hypothetical protein
VVETACQVEGVAYKKGSGVGTLTAAVNFSMSKDDTEEGARPDPFRERFTGEKGWMLIQIPQPLSPLARALLKGGDPASLQDAKLLVCPVVPDDEAATTAVQAGFRFKAGIATLEEKEGELSVVVHEAWPCAILPESSFSAEELETFAFESFTFFSPKEEIARYSPGLLVLRVLCTPLAFLVDVPLVLLRGVGQSFAR